MPRKESSASFDAGAKHFFRRVHDPHAPRDNPLVGHLFKASLTGLAEAARQATEELAGAAPSPHRMIEALRIGGSPTMDFGSRSWAEEAYATALGLASERLDGAPPRSRALALASLDLFGSGLAHNRGESRQALVLAERANARLEASLAGAAPLQISRSICT
jgi:hypothetical protein